LLLEQNAFAGMKRSKLLFNMSSASAASRKGKKDQIKIDLTEEQKQDIREAFDLFDTDGSGTEKLKIQTS
jgi:hypothetical protein